MNQLIEMLLALELASQSASKHRKSLIWIDDDLTKKNFANYRLQIEA